MLLGVSTIDYLARTTVPAGGLTILISKLRCFYFCLHEDI